MTELFSAETLNLAAAAISRCKADGLVLVTAESCTGGLIAAALTAVAGSSQVVHGGYVTYANRAKMDMIGVDQQTLDDFGAVSRETAIEMAEGARKAAEVDLAVSVTGIAGPDGGSEHKPVGLVHFGLSAKTMPCLSAQRHFEQMDRHQIRLASVHLALQMICDAKIA